MKRVISEVAKSQERDCSTRPTETGGKRRQERKRNGMVTWSNASAQRSLFATPTRYPGGKRRTEVAQGAETEGPVAGDERGL